MNPITFKPIGIIHSPFNRQEGTPIQPAAAQGARGHIEIFDDYIDGICDLDGFSHIYLLFHLHLSKSYRLKVKPYLDNQLRGVFATRAPGAPTPSACRLSNCSTSAAIGLRSKMWTSSTAHLCWISNPMCRR